MIKHLALSILMTIYVINFMYSQSQNIGFGTSNPQVKLDIVGGSGATNLLRVVNDGSSPYIKKELENNRFVIAAKEGSNAVNANISWLVTCINKDYYSQKD